MRGYTQKLVAECLDQADNIRQLCAFDELRSCVGQSFNDLTGSVEQGAGAQFSEQVDKSLVVEPIEVVSGVVASVHVWCEACAFLGQGCED